MDEGGKSSSSSTFSSLSQVFPMSWFSKIKQMGKKNQSPPAKTKRKTKPFSYLSSKITKDIAGEDDCDSDRYWQFSFARSKSNKGVVSSGLYDSYDDLELPLSSCPSCRSCNREIVGKDDTGKFNDMVCNVRKKRDLGYEDREDGKVQASPRRRIQKGRKSIKVDRRILEEMVNSGREVNGVCLKSMDDSLERNNLDLEVMDTSSKTFECFSSPISNHLKQRRGNKREDQESHQSLEKLEVVLEEEEAKSEKKAAKISKFQELQWLKSEKQRKSVSNRESHKKRAKQSYKVKVHSPRMLEICKIKALEDMKKAKTRKKDSIIKKGKALENFAVMKCSFDPQNDFKDSMVEMIVEKSLWSPEELENLLACYLSLNSVEYHDLIVQVFQQLWLEINHLRSRFGLQIDG
ncbi:Transcription repressor ofp5 [Thalictrum thalictroides]|uniref:Transcription repressor n=1 Tax=Thalictrum thalictroides TaxID=46969 RepID=A0A7J6WWN3_THATH|nr:Transcription repressor ofp5 [Thalictrum thalictroides]